MSALTLYSTAGCSLCEKLLDILLALPEAAGFQLQVVDVAYNDELLDAYGENIPVLRLGHAGGVEYAGPLQSEDLAIWLREHRP